MSLDIDKLTSDAQRAMRFEIRCNALHDSKAVVARCMVMTSVAGPCAVPDRHPSGSPAHVGPSAIYCAAHCPVCNFTMPDRTGEVVTLTGEQEGLFG